MKDFVLLLLGVLPLYLFAQPVLKPSIGLSHLPNDQDSICPIGIYHDPDMSFESCGLHNGDTIPQFKLYQASGDSTDIVTELAKGKPILIMTGSYTCPIFRGRVPHFQSLVQQYAGQISFFIVYVIEAHPDSPDVCPYTGQIWVTDENIQEGILYRQPKTYGERKAIVEDVLKDSLLNIQVPVLIDGPCNAFWKTFNTAPNSAFLITPEGILYKKQGWFNKMPYNMKSDIDTLLKLLSVKEQSRNIATGSLVFPNPAQNLITFNFQSMDIQGKTLELFDFSGKTIMKKSTNQTNRLQVDVSDFNNGLYFYRIEGTTCYGKFVISR